MANYRIRPNGIIQYDLHVFGIRFRETSKMPATPKNIKIAKATVKQINAELELNTFEYRDFFPNSKKSPNLRHCVVKKAQICFTPISMTTPMNG